MGMPTWKLKTLWNRVRRTVEEWMDGEESPEASDASLMFHLVVFTPLLIGVLALMRKT
jgi:hypothetical protein